MPETVTIKTRKEAAAYRVEIARDSLVNAGNWAQGVLRRQSRICIVSNETVFGLYGDALVQSLSAAGFEPFVHFIGDGERFKNMKTLGSILESFSRHEISRTDAVIGFGGGVVGDIAGFAASIHLRGANYLQIPTSLLAMVDSSVGGKNGLNNVHGKNLIGTFYHPKGVLIDPNVLSTLPQREITAGLCECIKQAAISGPKLLNNTISMLDPIKRLKMQGLTEEFDQFLAGQITFKARIIKADERESIDKFDARSRKTLNFGHTFAHSLEKAGDYKLLKHGEAVGYGIMFAAKLSKNLGLLDDKVVNLLCDVVHRAGVLPRLRRINPGSVFENLRHDKKNVNNSLHWILLKAIGKPVIVPHHQIGDRLVRSLIKDFISSK